MPTSRAKIGLSTSSAFPDGTRTTFQLAHELGYDGVEVMVTSTDTISTDPTRLAALSRTSGVPILAIHAPTLLISQRTWGSDPWAKLLRAGDAAREVGADIVVVHPAFRWQRNYASTFVDGIRQLNEQGDVTYCVENMYPWKSPRGEVHAYAPGWDPTDLAIDHLCLDLSHASVAGQRSLELVERWGTRLRHVHLTDGMGGVGDPHLPPGEGDQRAGDVLAALAARDFAGHVVVEVNPRRSKTVRGRESVLAGALAFARQHLGALTPVA